MISHLYNYGIINILTSGNDLISQRPSFREIIERIQSPQNGGSKKMDREMDEDFGFPDFTQSEVSQERLNMARALTRHTFETCHVQSPDLRKSSIAIDKEVLKHMEQWVNCYNYSVTYCSQTDGLERKSFIEKMRNSKRFMVVVETNQFIFGGFYADTFPVPPSVSARYMSRKEHFGFIFFRDHIENPLVLKPKNYQGMVDKSLIIPALDEYVRDTIISFDFFVVFSDGTFVFSNNLPKAYSFPNLQLDLTFPTKGNISNVYCIDWF